MFSATLKITLLPEFFLITLSFDILNKVIARCYKTRFESFTTHTRYNEVLTRRTLCSINNTKRILLIHGKLAKMHVVKNLLKSNYGRPFFVCADQSNPYSFWAWGDVRHVAKPKCHHGFPCVTKGQFPVFKLPCCGHYAHTECFKTWASLSHKESTVRCAYCALCKNTPKNSIVRRAVTQKFTQNAQQTSQFYSRC